MNRDDVFEIYGKLGNYNPKNISDIYIECDRSIIEIDGLKFYKSTGESRNIGLTDIWLPYEGCEKTLTNRERVIKSEDKYIDDWNANNIDSILIENDKYDLEKYKRFINKKYAIISKWLYDNYDTTNRTNKMRTKRRNKIGHIVLKDIPQNITPQENQLISNFHYYLRRLYGNYVSDIRSYNYYQAAIYISQTNQLNNSIRTFISDNYISSNVHISVFFYKIQTQQQNPPIRIEDNLFHRPHVSLHLNLKSIHSKIPFKIELHYGTDKTYYKDVRKPTIWMVISSTNKDFDEYPIVTDTHSGIEVMTNKNQNTVQYRVQYNTDWNNTFKTAIENSLNIDDDHIEERYYREIDDLLKTQINELQTIYNNYMTNVMLIVHHMGLYSGNSFIRS